MLIASIALTLARRGLVTVLGVRMLVPTFAMRGAVFVASAAAVTRAVAMARALIGAEVERAIAVDVCTVTVDVARDRTTAIVAALRATLAGCTPLTLNAVAVRVATAAATATTAPPAASAASSPFALAHASLVRSATLARRRGYVPDFCSGRVGGNWGRDGRRNRRCIGILDLRGPCFAFTPGLTLAAFALASAALTLTAPVASALAAFTRST